MDSVGVFTSVVGQLDGSCISHCGPFHHNVEFESVAGSTHFEMRSTGLDGDGTCLHVAEAVSSCIVAILLPTMSSICLMDPVSMSIQWKTLSMSMTH